MNYLKTYEGLFDFLKKKKYTDSFSKEEWEKISESLYIDKLVKVELRTDVEVAGGLSFDPKIILREIEIFIGKGSRSTLNPQYNIISKQDSEYYLTTHLDENVYKTIDEVIDEVKKNVLYCLVDAFIEPIKVPFLNWNSLDISEEQFKESKSLVNDYSVLSGNKLNLARLNMLLDDYFDVKLTFNNEEWVEMKTALKPLMENKRKELIDILLKYFQKL